MQSTAPFPRTPFIVLAVLAVTALLLSASGPLTVVVSRWALATTAGLAPVGLLSLAAVGALAAGTAGAVLHAWLRHRDRLASVAGASLGVVLAYGTSTLAKATLAEARPCVRWESAGRCPPVGDWSLPSNHATVAFAALVVIAAATRSLRATWAASGLAVLTAAGRVLEGVHYLHDVAAGAVLGTGVAAVCAWCAVVAHRALRTRRRD